MQNWKNNNAPLENIIPNYYFPNNYLPKFIVLSGGSNTGGSYIPGATVTGSYSWQTTQFPYLGIPAQLIANYQFAGMTAGVTGGGATGSTGTGQTGAFSYNVLVYKTRVNTYKIDGQNSGSVIIDTGFTGNIALSYMAWSLVNGSGGASNIKLSFNGVTSGASINCAANYGELNLLSRGMSISNNAVMPNGKFTVDSFVGASGSFSVIVEITNVLP